MRCISSSSICITLPVHIRSFISGYSEGIHFFLVNAHTNASEDWRPVQSFNTAEFPVKLFPCTFFCSWRETNKRVWNSDWNLAHEYYMSPSRNVYAISELLLLSALLESLFQSTSDKINAHSSFQRQQLCHDWSWERERTSEAQLSQCQRLCVQLNGAYIYTPIYARH